MKKFMSAFLVVALLICGQTLSHGQETYQGCLDMWNAVTAMQQHLVLKYNNLVTLNCELYEAEEHMVVLHNQLMGLADYMFGVGLTYGYDSPEYQMATMSYNAAMWAVGQQRAIIDDILVQQETAQLLYDSTVFALSEVLETWNSHPDCLSINGPWSN